MSGEGPVCRIHKELIAKSLVRQALVKLPFLHKASRRGHICGDTSMVVTNEPVGVGGHRVTASCL